MTVLMHLNGVNHLAALLHYGRDLRVNIAGIRTHRKPSQVACLNLRTNAIILWNRVYVGRALNPLEQDGYAANVFPRTTLPTL